MHQEERKTKERYVVAIELGSSKAKIGVAGFDPDDERHTLTVYNTASMPTVDSVRYGRIANIREVTSIVNSLLESVAKKSPIEDRSILSVYLSVGGRSLKSRHISARKVLPERREITEELVEGLQSDAIDSMATSDEILCVEPVRYNVNNMPTPRPVGVLGSRLSGEFTAVVCHPSNRNDMEEVVSERVGLNISGISIRPISIAHLVLSPQETNAGCMLVDFGAETITVSIYKKYALQYLATIPLGSRLITKDLATALALTEEEAEALKINLANAIPEKSDNPEEVQTLETVNAVVTARLADIIANIAAQPGFAKMTPESLPSGIILTGGGAKLRNFANVLSTQTKMKVRVATIPVDIIINDSELASPDNIDLIALLNESAECARSEDSIECLSAATTREEPVVKEYGSVDTSAAHVSEKTERKTAAKENEPAVIFDFTGEGKKVAKREETNYENQNYGHVAAAFGGGQHENVQKGGVIDYVDHGEDQDFTDFLDDEDVERIEKQRKKAEEQKIAKEKAEAKARAEKEKLMIKREKEKELRQKEKEKQEEIKANKRREKINTPGRLDKLMGRINTWMSGLSGDDESADMD